MDQNSIDSLYQSINKSADKRIELYELVIKNEQQVNSTQSERNHLVLVQNFLKSEILDTVEYYNAFVEFINSVYVLKSFDDRDSQEIITWLMSQKSKASEIMQNLSYDAGRLAEELAKLNSQQQIILNDTQQLGVSLNEMKVVFERTQNNIEEQENINKNLEEKLLDLKKQNEEFLAPIQELVDKLSEKNTEIETYEHNFNVNMTAEKLSLTKEYKLKIDILRSNISEKEKQWNYERLNQQMKFEELKNTRKDKEVTLQQELDELQREVDTLNQEYNSSDNDVLNLNRKISEIDNLEHKLEVDGDELKHKLNLMENQLSQKELNHINKMKQLRESKAEERNTLQIKFNNLCQEHELLKTQLNQRRVVSSSQVTSSSSVRFTDNIFEVSSDELNLDPGQKGG